MSNFIESISTRFEKEIESIEKDFPMATINWSADDWISFLRSMDKQKIDCFDACCGKCRVCEYLEAEEQAKIIGAVFVREPVMDDYIDQITELRMHCGQVEAELEVFQLRSKGLIP